LVLSDGRAIGAVPTNSGDVTATSFPRVTTSVLSATCPASYWSSRSDRGTSGSMACAARAASRARLNDR